MPLSEQHESPYPNSRTMFVTPNSMTRYAIPVIEYYDRNAKEWVYLPQGDQMRTYAAKAIIEAAVNDQFFASSQVFAEEV